MYSYGGIHQGGRQECSRGACAGCLRPGSRDMTESGIYWRVLERDALDRGSPVMYRHPGHSVPGGTRIPSLSDQDLTPP